LADLQLVNRGTARHCKLRTNVRQSSRASATTSNILNGR
jgi:hypothetical protein